MTPRATSDALDVAGVPPVVEVVVTYARTIFDVHHCGAGAYTVGESSRASFQVAAPQLLAACVPLIRWQGGAPSLCFARTHGVLVRDGRAVPLISLVDPERAEHDGVYSVPLGEGASATVQYGAVTFAVRRVPAARNLARLAGIDFTPTRHIVGSAVVLGLLMGAAFHSSPGGGDLEFDVSVEELRFVGYRVGRDADPPEEPASAPRVQRERPRHGGESGRLGKPSTRARRGRFVLERHDEPLLAHYFNPEREPIVESLLGLQRAWPGGILASPYAESLLPGQTGERDVWSGRAGRVVDAFGIGGLGRRGTGRGAGGVVSGATLGRSSVDRRGARVEYGDRPTLRPLTQADVRRVLGWRRAALGRCGALGAATVHFTVRGSGQVRDVEVHAGDGEARAADCVARVVKRVWFPRRLGSTRVVYPVPAPTLTRFPRVASG